MNDVKRSKIKIRQLNNEILSLSKRLKKSNRIFDLLIINKEVSISFVSKGKNKDKKYSEKQIKEYNDNSDANYNNLKIGKNKQKDKNNGKNNISDKSTRIKADYKTKSKNKKANNSNLNKNRMHLNYIYKIQRNMTNIMDFINDQNECFTPYHINKIDSGSLKNETKKKIRSRETSPSSQDKLKYSTVIQSNKRNKSQILLNSGGNIEKIKLYRKIKDYHKLFDKKLSQITRNIMPKSIRRTLSAFQHIRNSSPNFYDSYRNLCNNNNINSNNKNSNLSLKRKNKYRQLNKSNSTKNYHNISATSNKKYSINFFRKKTPNKVNSQRKEITPNIKIKNNFHNLCSNSNSKSKMQFNDNLRKSIDNSEQKKQFKKININNANNISAPINNLNSYNSTKDSNKVKNLINKDNILKNANKINNNNIIDGMLNNILIIANIKNKFEVNTVSHGANKHNSFQKFKYNLSGNSVSSNKK
jgi:hypothetical protein